jgi:branched-chain amino acid transport system ATP-binding protein
MSVAEHQAPALKTSTGAGPLLSVAGVKASYGNIAALKGVDLAVNEGEIVALIGANGAGKTTLMMTICGDPRAHEGKIHFGGREITGLKTYEIARLGLAHCPEGRRIFPRMTIFENLQMGASFVSDTYFASDLERVYSIFPRLKERAAQRGGTLSGGEQQMLAIGRALMSRPRLLMLDEPSLGLGPLAVKQIFEVILHLNKEAGLTVLLVEQNALVALRIADRAYVMINGLITMAGGGPDLLARPEIRAAYLGGCP